MGYLLFLLPALLLALYAQTKVKGAMLEGGKVLASSGFSGAETAARILQRYGITDVRIEPTNGMLGDHYDPSNRALRLSPDVYHGRTLTALGIAAHEAGHAIQDATKYAPLTLRNGIVPMASVGGNLSFVFILLGFFLQSVGLLMFGVVLYSIVVLFQLVNLPVEYNASSRAKEILVNHGFVSPSELGAVDRVLNAAALTYVAATLGAVLTLLYYLIQLGVFGSRD